MKKFFKSTAIMSVFCFITMFFPFYSEIGLIKAYAAPANETFESSSIAGYSNPEYSENWMYSILKKDGSNNYVNDYNSYLYLDNGVYFINKSLVFNDCVTSSTASVGAIKSAKGMFKLTSFDIVDYYPSIQNYKVVGYLLGVPKFEQPIGNISSPTPVNILPSNKVNIDEFRIFNLNGVTELPISFAIDNIIVSNPSPILQSTSYVDDTHIKVSLNENCTNLTKSNDGGFTVSEIGTGTPYSVASISQEDSSHVILAVPDIGKSAKEGLTITYTNGGNGNIQSVSSSSPMDTNSLNLSPWDITVPTISSAVLASDNSYIDITLSEGIYGATNGVSPISKDKLLLTFQQSGGTATGVSISSVKKDDNTAEASASPLTGGESVIRVFLNITGTPSGVEKITISPQNTNSIFDKAGNNMSATQITGSKALNDMSNPKVNFVNSSSANGTYKSGDVITITVTFDKAVDVTGAPVLHLETGSTDHDASYTGGSGTSMLTFNYTVQAGDTAVDLDYKGSDSLDLNGGTIKSVGGLDANLTLPAPGSASSLGDSKAIVIDTLTYTIYPIPNVTMQTVAEGNAGIPFTVTITNAGTGTLTNVNVSISGFKFMAIPSTIPSLNSGQSYTLTVITNPGLPAGTYTEIGTIFADNMFPVTFTVTQVVTSGAPTITTQPANETVIAGQNASFSVAATGTGTLSYKWYKNNTEISGQTSFTLNLANLQKSDEGSYKVLITNSYGTIESDVATLTVNDPAPSANVMTVNPIADINVANGTAKSSIGLPGSVNVVLENSNTETANITWDNGTPVYNGNNAGTYEFKGTLTLPSGVTNTNNKYAAVNVIVEPGTAPSITTQPVNKTVTAGQNASFNVAAATATGTLSYKWYKDNTEIIGQTSSTLNLTNVQKSDEGSYKVLITNSYGSVESDVATLTVNDPAPSANVMTVNSIGDINVANGTAKSAIGLPGSVNVVLENSNNETANITWDNGTPVYNGNNAGTYEFKGTLTLPSGVTNTNNKYAAVNVVVAPNNGGSTAPTITTQPVNKTVTAGQNASFNVAATGTGTLSYKWYKNNTEIIGQISSTLNLTNVQKSDEGSYKVKVSDGSGSFVESNTVTLTVNNPAAPANVMTVNPISNINVANGTAKSAIGLPGSVSVVLENSNNETANITWDNGTPVYNGNNAGTYQFKGTLTLPSGVTNTNNKYAAVNVVVAPAGGVIPPTVNSVTVTPPSANIVQGGSIKLFANVNVTGTLANTVNWSSSDVSNKVAVDNTGLVTIETDAGLGDYIITAVSTADGTKSGTSKITVTKASVIPPTPPTPPVNPTNPIIKKQPSSQTVRKGNTASFSIQVSGIEPFIYQWQKDGLDLIDGDDISGSNNSKLKIKDVRKSDEGIYSCIVTDGNLNVTTSSGATLRVTSKSSSSGSSSSKSSSSNNKVSDTVTINSTKSGETTSSNANDEIAIIDALNTKTTKAVIVNFDDLGETNKSALITQSILANLKANPNKTLIIKTINSSIEIKSNIDGQIQVTENGTKIIGFKTIASGNYYLDDSGVIQTGWIKKEDGSWYHFNNNSGTRDSGWFQDIDGAKYYLDEATGIMKTGWFKDANNTWYYFDKISGAMKSGWIQDNGKWYYLYSDGKLAVSTTIDGYNVNEKGEWVL